MKMMEQTNDFEIPEYLSILPRASCVLIRRGRKFLGVARKDDPTLFSLPGGKLEPGEDFRKAALRELLEEAGVVGIDLRPVFIDRCPAGSGDDAHDYLCATYEADYAGEPKHAEGPEVRFCDPHELIAISPFGEYNRRLFEKIGIAV